MATLINQWANEAAIVLVYWNTLRKIEDFSSISVLNVLLSYYWMTSLTHSNKRNENLHVLKGDCYLSCGTNCTVCQEEVLDQRKEQKKKQRSQHCPMLCFSDTQACLDWGWFGGQISRQGNFVRATCRAADYPWAGIIFCLSKNVNCLFLRVGKD